MKVWVWSCYTGFNSHSGRVEQREIVCALLRNCLGVVAKLFRRCCQNSLGCSPPDASRGHPATQRTLTLATLDASGVNLTSELGALGS